MKKIEIENIEIELIIHEFRDKIISSREISELK